MGFRRGLTRAGWIGGVVLGLLALSGCEAPLRSPAATGQIVKVAETTTADGWRYEEFHNLAYPCSISGYQSFVIGTRIGDDPTDPRPLWVRLRGGGSGYFNEAGVAVPDDKIMVQELHTTLRSQIRQPGLVARVLDRQDLGFRGLAVSMCNRDVYGGSQNLDPNNPHPNADGSARRTNGLLSTKAAIQFARNRHETSKFFLHGGSAGSVGTYHVSLALQRQGLPAAGIVADGGIRNDDWEAARLDQDICKSLYGGPEWYEGFSPRVHTELRDPARQPHEMVPSGELTVPIVQVWTHGDPTSCGSLPMACPLPGGPVMMDATDCKNEPLRAAIAAQGPESRSLSIGVCVTRVGSPEGACDVHVSTGGALPNTNDQFPADYLAVIAGWVDDRLADNS